MDKVFIVLGFLIFGGLIAFGPNIYEHFGKRYMSAERNVYEENYSYVRGKIQMIDRMKLEYETAEDEHKSAFRSAILNEVSSFDTSKLPIHQQHFINKLRGEF